jgi:hypothetical protein
VALTVTVELPPLHRIGVFDELALNALGSVMLPVAVAMQLLASVTVTEYEPAPCVKLSVPL